MDWPKTCPPDLRRRLETVLSFRSFGAAEIWTELEEWLIAHGVAPPDDLPEDPPIASGRR
jgi:hypothetical protein